MSRFNLTRTGDTEWCALDEESGVCVMFTEQRYNETNHVVPGQRMRERVEEMGAGEAATGAGAAWARSRAAAAARK